jgi:hypothetical protein
MPQRSTTMRLTLVNLALAALIGASASALAQHDHDLRSGQIRKTVGVVSDEVALARLKTAGVENPKIMRRQDTKVFITGTVQGQHTEIEFDALSGHAVEATPARRMLIGPQGGIDQPHITGTQVPVDHKALSNPALMRDVVVPR